MTSRQGAGVFVADGYEPPPEPAAPPAAAVAPTTATLDDLTTPELADLAVRVATELQQRLEQQQ